MLKLVSVLVLMLTLGVGNAWGLTAVYNFGSDDVLSALGISKPSSGKGTDLSNSANYTIGSVTMTTTHGSTNTRVWNSSGTLTLRVYGTAGSLTFSVPSGYKITQIAFASKSGLSASPAGSWSSNTWTAPANTTSATFTKTTSGSNNNGSITVTYEAAAIPTVTPDPTSLSWGTVLQGSSQSTKTITITGANLTAGTLTISATGGYSVTPTSKSVSGTLAATTLTVTPPSTSTTGAKNGKVTISGGGLASNVEVDLSMTVNAASTVTWMNNGSEYTTTLVANGSKPEFPDDPSSCDGTSTTFVGWTPTPWSGKLDDVSSKTIYTSGSAMPNVSGPVTYHAVFAKSSGSETEHTLTLNKEKFYDAGATSSGYANTDLTIDGIVMKRSQWGWQQNGVNVYLQGKNSNAMYNDTQLGYIKSIAITKYGGSGNIYVGTSKQPTTNETAISTTTLNYTKSNNYTYFRINSTSTLQLTSVVITYVSGGVTYSKYLTTCCADPGLAYGTGSVVKTYGASAFTNTLTNSHSVAVTYASSDPTVATVNGSGQVTILKAGSTTITASSVAQTVSTVDYCADEASYTLTVNKADISPTLTYSPASVAVGENSSAPSVSGNTGSGTVSYAITSATPAGCATINASTGVVTGVAVGSVTVTATVAATTNYNGNTATATVSVTAASNFPNGKTIFIQANSSSAWNDNACVVAWFHSYGGSETAQSTYWLFDATDDDAGKKLFAAVVPASGNLPYLDINRFASDCTTPWNKNGGCSYSDASGSNTVRSEGSGNDQVYWNPSPTALYLYGSQNSWGSSLGTFADQGAGVWTATISNYTPDATSKDYKIKTSYNNGWIGNTGSNNNATLSDMIVGSTYNVTATLDVTDHSLVMSKEFVKGTVHFDLQGHGLAISDLTNVTAGSKISAPSAPSATGYDFGGWYKEPACTNAWNFGSDVVNETMTLYAKWTAHEYTITKTLTNVTSSPVIPSTYTYTGAAAGLNYTISPSDGYRLPTEITVSGTTYTWNPATGALALTGTIASNVTITIVAVQTHTVDWYVGGSAPGNKLPSSGQTVVVDHGGSITTLPSEPSGSACDKEFMGWTNTSSYTHGTSPLYSHNTASFPAINADASFYAVFATESGSATTYTLVSDAASFTDGTYVVAALSSSTYYFMDGNGTADGLGVETTGLSSSSVSAGSFTASNLPTGAIEIEVEDDEEPDGDDHYYFISYSDATNTYYMDDEGTKQSLNWTTNTTVYTYHPNFTQNAGTDGCVLLSGSGAKVSQNGSNKASFIRNYASGGSFYNDIYFFKKSGGITYSDYTIVCGSCSNEVTVSFSAPGSGNTMTVAKGVTSISSGDAVKTCSAVSLTVTLTPAAHYTVTNFTATGVTGVTTSNVGNVYTVNIPADKTGTLTLTPTFTAETPLTITLDTHSKGTFTPIGTIYSGDSFTFPEVTPNDAECADFVGWVEGTSIAEEGTSTEPTTIAAGSSSGTLTTNKTYTAVYAEKDKTESDAYVKVTSSLSNWSGTYLIVHDGSSRALDGSLTTTLGSTGDYFSVSITDGAIAATSTLATKNWTIAKIGETSTYTIKSASGYYIGRATASNGLDYTTTAGDADANSITYSSGVSIAGSASTAKLQYWVSGANACFKYYTSSQNAVSLYKLGTAEVVTYTYTVNPACTAKYRVTVNSATGGSPNADPKYLPEGETVTLTANPAAGYTFTSWTITKTTGGDNVTSTLLTGDKPTTSNTTFAMPAYDVTVTATYAKIYVTSVVAKDGETTLNTSDHKLNINTGANKTVTVVVTPADAFDHSWSAEVTSGGTYASISNVTSEGFRVNGLAEGDATIVVTAPNDDGADKTATFTVHVTDVLPEEIILKRDGSNTPIETLTMYYDASESKGQYVKVNVSYSPANPTNKAFTFSSAATGKVGSHSHAPASGYEVLVANGVTSDAVNCTFTSSADGSVTKVLAVTVLPILSDRFVDYVHGNATQTVSARLSDDRYSIIPDINTPSLSDASDANPTSEDCETSHYHLVGWLPQTTAEALWAAGTPITDATEGLVRAGESVEATGQTWCAIWAEEQ